MSSLQLSNTRRLIVTEYPLHRLSNEDVKNINKQRLKEVINHFDETFEVSAGDSVYIPSKVAHSYKAGKDGLEFLCVVPNKEDKIEILE